MKKILNILLLVTLVLSMLAPMTSVGLHKMVSTLFLVLCIIHSIKHKSNMKWSRIGLLSVTILAFISGFLALIFDHNTIFSSIHTVISIIIACFISIHIFVFRSILFSKK